MSHVTGKVRIVADNDALFNGDFEMQNGEGTVTIQTQAGSTNITAIDDSQEMVFVVMVFENPLPFVAHMWAERVPNRGWLEYDLHSYVENGIPPFFPIWNDIRHPYFGTMHVDKVPAGKYEVIVMDSHNCVSRVQLTLEEHETQMCPELYKCQLMIEFHHSNYVQCLRRVAWPLLWNTDNWNHCQARAALDVIRAMHVPYNRNHGELTEVVGAASMTLVLGEALYKCNKQHGARYCNFPWHFLDMFFAERPEALKKFQSRNFEAAWFDLLGVSPEVQTDVLILAPYGYNNDPVSAPMMALPLQVAVTVLVIDGKEFPSQGVQCGRFPWTIQIDVYFGALYAHYAMRYLRPKWILPSDNGGILIISRLGSLLDESSPFRDTFDRSVGWPVAYPPTLLSKLFPGHEKFATKEVVVTENDGGHAIDLDLDRLKRAYDEFDSSIVVIKREYSEDSLGVRFASSWSRLEQHARKLMPRQEGVGFMDLKMRTRLFLQEPVASCRISYGARVFAQAGRVLAMASSQVVDFSAKLTFHYRTFRDPDFEARVIGLAKASNMTGFITSWWCKSSVPEKEYFLIDFNARIERHACLLGVLSDEDQHLDPCYVFQELVAGIRRAEDFPTPNFVPANVTYFDPIRMSWIDRKWTEEQIDKRMWNIQHHDPKLAEWVDDMLPDEVRHRQELSVQGLHDEL